MSKIDEKSGITVWEEDIIRVFHQNYTLAGVPTKTTVEMAANTEEFLSVITPYPIVNHYFEESEKIQIV